MKDTRKYKGFEIVHFLAGWFVYKDGISVAAWLPTLKSAKSFCS